MAFFCTARNEVGIKKCIWKTNNKARLRSGAKEMKIINRARKVLSGVMVVSMVLGGVVVTKPTEVFALEKTNGSTKRNVMYYGDWSVWGGQGNFYPKDIPADQLTHLNFAFLDFDAQGNLIFTDKDAATGNPVGQPGVTWGDVNAGILPALVELRAQNPNLKIGISIGGWSKSGDFSDMAANDASRARFVENVMKFVEYTNMDFVDIDWEYPASVRQPDLVDNKNDEGTPHARPEDKENYIVLLEDLRKALDEKEVELGKTFELSVALPASQVKLAEGVDVKRMFEIIDFGNLMTYDMHGAFDATSGHQAGLYPNANDPMADSKYSVDETVDYMIEKGAPAEKLVIGAAYYTRGWEQVSEGTDANNPGLFGEAAIVGKDADQTPSRGAANEAPLASGDGGRRGGVWSYRSLDKLKVTYPGLKEYWDDEAKAPYLYDANSGAFFTYDNVRSIGEKTSYVHENDLGGVIAWMASQDAPTTSGKRDELTRATKKGLFGDGALTEHEIVYADLDITVSMTAYNESWGNTGGYEISIKNNERLEESGEVLELTEKMAETITLPKLYIKHSGPALSKGDYTAGTVTQEDGYTVVDFGSIYDGKAIVPGQTYTFRLKSTGPVDDISAIESIELAQRIKNGGVEIKQQTIYGDVAQVNQAPVIQGVKDITITVGDAFDAMAGVSAYDKEDGIITEHIVVEGEVDPNTEGEYTLTYTVSDSEGLTTTVLRKVIVEPKVPNQAPVLKGVKDITITLGDAFDAMAGVSATDKEDGVITERIVVDGEVDPNTAGAYTLCYTVADSEGLEASATRTVTVEEYVEPELPESDFGVGEGIVWDAQANVPFIDMAAWVTKPGYGNNGAPNLVKISEDTDVKFFNLGFIQSVGGQIRDNKLVWGWGGHEVLSEAAPDNAQYLGIKQSIRELRELGGDVVVSLGGLNGLAFWQATQDVEILTNTYMDLVTGYGLTRLDLDIEGGAQDKAQNIANAKAIKKVQDATGVKIVLTLPVNPDGLAYEGRNVVEAYLSEGVEIDVINLMTMCYGPANLLPGENYGTASVRAVDSAKSQLQDLYARFAGETLTNQEAYAKLGTTPSIGFEGSAHPIFTTEWAELIVNHAIEKGLAMTSFWSMNRDAQLENNQGISSQYEFTNIFKRFGSDEELPQVNKAPELKGIKDVTLTVGDAFDAREGVTASDKEDGDLTDEIVITGEVDTEVAGTYELVYSVSDYEGLETSATRTITVEEVVVEPNTAPELKGIKDVTLTAFDAFDAMAGVTAFDKEDGDLTDAIVIEGEVDPEVVGTYELVYSVSDSEGLATSATRIVTVEEEKETDPNNTYDATKVYNTGDKVMYDGKEYTAKWWTQGDIPGASDVWEVTVDVNPDGSQDYVPGNAYIEGDVVIYNGKTYTAKWWTTATPGSDDSWAVEGEENEDGSQDYLPGKAYVTGDIVSYEGELYEAKWWTTSTPGSDESWMKK